MTQHNHFLTIPQAAKHCSISRVTLWRWVKSGKLKAFVSPGGHYKIRKKDLESFIHQRTGYLSTADRQNKKKILIVDDEPDVQKMLAKILSASDYRAEIASDGLDAGIKIVQFKPDLIILDLFMPKMDGFEVCQRIKGDNDHSHIKILILTGFDTKENKDRTLSAGADGYLAKPIKKNDLLKHIGKLLGQDGEPTRPTIKEVVISD